jgi:hypothetical protein
MRRFWSLAAGLAVLVWGATGTARAETVALNFEIGSTRTTTVAEPAPKVDTIALSFEPEPMKPAVQPPIQVTPATVAQVAPPVAPATDAKNESDYALATLFEGGVNSLVAISVGNAEGTRTPDGGYTRFYNGHTDPGNRAWNLGTFSYQHGASSPEEADAKQLRRLQGQAQELRRQAEAKQIQMTLLEELNGIDLANQAPVTALDRGYIKWLERAKQTSMGEAERVVWARTRSFIHPDTGRWNAPGLGNTLESVTRDQRRRQQAISKVLEVQEKNLNSSL